VAVISFIFLKEQLDCFRLEKIEVAKKKKIEIPIHVPLRKYESAISLLIWFSPLLNFDLMISKVLSHIIKQPITGT
jgi:hypothetical protein